MTVTADDIKAVWTEGSEAQKRVQQKVRQASQQAQLVNASALRFLQASEQHREQLHRERAQAIIDAEGAVSPRALHERLYGGRTRVHRGFPRL